MIADLRAHVAKAGAFEVMEVSPAGHSGATSKEAAMRIFQTQRDGWDDRPGGFESYLNRDGYFTRGGMMIYAVIPGARENILAKFGGHPGTMEPCAYIVYEMKDKADDEPFAWYIRALEIMVETFDYVLALPEDERARCVLHWSG